MSKGPWRRPNDKGRTASIPSKSGPAAPAAAAPPTGNGVAPDAAKPSVGVGGMAGVAQAGQVVEEARARRRANREGDNAPVTRSARAQQAALDAELASIASDLYSAENFEDLVMLPGDIGFAATGHDHWLPTERAKRVLARTGAAAARLMGADPRYLALGLFTTTMISTYGTALVKSLYINRMKRMRPVAAEEPEKKS